MIIVPEMIGTVVGIYNGKVFNQVEIKVYALLTSFVILMSPFSPKWLDTTLASSPSPTSPPSTVVLVSVPLVLPSSFLLSKQQTVLLSDVYFT